MRGRRYLWKTLWIALIGLTWTAPAAAEVTRYALVVGNNVGAPADQPLRYAESDARRMHQVLTALGDFPPWQALLLQGADVATVRRALLNINERIRDASEMPGQEVFLLVYYSGHADAQALHLAGGELPIAELQAMTRSSAADLRMLVLDSCRSGALTRVKGGHRAPPFSVPRVQLDLPTEGFAFLAASTALEDAQESDALGGSFFTHALLSGMLGAADTDGDGSVVLDEAYRYAYDNTLRATSRTLVGPQHPTFHYHLKGRGHWVLTRPGVLRGNRSVLHIPNGYDGFVMREDEQGPVVAEVSKAAPSRAINLEAGEYFVRLRGVDVLFEGSLHLDPGDRHRVKTTALRRVDYARLVRKGALPPRAVAHSLELDTSLRTALPSAPGPCVGAGLGYAVDWHGLGVRSHLGFCESTSHNEVVQMRVRTLALELLVYRAWDLTEVTLDLGLGIALNLSFQSFETAGHAPPRRTLHPALMMGGGAQIFLTKGLYLRASLLAQTHILRIRESSESHATGLLAGLALRTGLGLGKQF